MPYLRCLDTDECGWEGYERSQLAVGSQCPRCDGDTVVVTDYDEPIAPEPVAHAARSLAHLAVPRERARRLLREHEVTEPPVPVQEIARCEGLAIKESHSLGSLRGRLIDEAIEVAADDSWAVQRFTVAHELGHHFLGSTHGSGKHVESEANAFAGELLVPGPFLHAALVKATSEADLARAFQVSRTALRIAAENHHVLGKLT
jgi:hypothetical protein